MQIHSVLKKSVIATGVAAALASSGAQAISTGTDLNLTAKAAAGGMAGAAYVRPQEASAAVFGNPATLTQFKGFNMNFGASFLVIEELKNEQSSTVADGPFGGSYYNESISDADNYIVPDVGITLEIAPGLVIGTGLEVDAGLGGDYRDDPVMLLGDMSSTALAAEFSVPINVELISFNANLAAGYQVNEKLSIGGALTVGFGLFQLGTTGSTQDLNTLCGALAACPVFGDFGGTTSSVHDIGFGGSLGATYAVQDGVMIGATLKSPVEYNFRNAMYSQIAVLKGGDGWQDITMEQPLEAIVGVALDNVLLPNLLVEIDAIFKKWSEASGYEDAYEDQWLLAIGGQYTMNSWKFRLGYSYAEKILKNVPNSTLSNLDGIGTLPLGGSLGLAEGIGTDVVAAFQTALVPVIWQHTVTAGVGYNFTENLRLDAYGAYAFGGESASRNLPTISSLAAAALGSTSVVQEFKGSLESEWMVGVGLNIAMP